MGALGQMFEHQKSLKFLVCLFLFIGLARCSSYDPDEPVSVTINDTVVKKSPSRLGVNIGASTYFGDKQISSVLLPHGDFPKGQQVTLIRNQTPHPNIISDRYARPDKPLRAPYVSFEGGTYYIGSGPRAGETGKIIRHKSGSAEFTLEHTGVPIEMDDLIWLKGLQAAMALPVSPLKENEVGIGGFRSLSTSTAELKWLENPARPDDQIMEIRFGRTGSNRSGGLKHYFYATPSTEYVARVRARSDSEHARLGVSITNLGIPHGQVGDSIQLRPDASNELTSDWKVYTFRGKSMANKDITERFSAFKFTVGMGDDEVVNRTAQIDWVELEDGGRHSETGFNAKLLPILEEARPGVIRFYQLASSGATVDSITARSSMSSSWKYISNGKRYGMHPTHAVLDNCFSLTKQIGAAPWVVVGGANDPNDWYQLISYLSAPAEYDDYSRKRASHGYTAPWMESFDTIYLEIGNEWWNTIFRPFHIWNGDNYGEFCNTIIEKIRSHPHFDEDRIKIVVGGWAANAREWNAKLDKTVKNHDFISIAPYLANRLDQFETQEDKYGSLFSDVEGYAVRSGQGLLNQLKKTKKGTSIAVYELNTHLTKGKAPASVASEICTSVGAGIAVLDMAMALTQEMNASPVAYFTLLKRGEKNKDGIRLGLWGNLIREADGDFRARPIWEGLKLANNHLIQGDMVKIDIDNNLTWEHVENGSVPAMKKVPAIHVYGFRSISPTTKKRQLNVLVINRSLTEEIPVDLKLPFSVDREVITHILTGVQPSDNNETSEKIKIKDSNIEYDPGTPIWAKPFSAVVYQFHES